MLSAVIFDFDGIIVDTEPLHYKAFQEVLVPLGLGYSWEEYISRYIGFDDRDAFREAYRVAGKALGDAELHELIRAKAGAFQNLIACNVEPYPGVVELINEISGKVPLALCSGALLTDILPILRQLDIEEEFDVVVTADDVHASKPDPASYALAVKRLNTYFPQYDIVPAGCLAIEDTPAGIASATGAGIKVLAVTNSYPEEKLTKAWRVVDSLDGVSLDSLRTIF
ncbi:MAG: HAD family phosphatase [Geobacter sp.]|nr:HAD family phosphatase [Geobacter sp.]